MTAIADGTWITIALIALLAVALLRNRNISAKVGNMEVMVGEIHRATNDRPPNAPTLSHQVLTMAARVDAIASEVKQVKQDLATHMLANPGLPKGEQGPPRPRYGA